MTTMDRTAQPADPADVARVCWACGCVAELDGDGRCEDCAIDGCLPAEGPDIQTVTLTGGWL